MIYLNFILIINAFNLARKLLLVLLIMKEAFLL